jgi:hypothetical protein
VEKIRASHVKEQRESKSKELRRVFLKTRQPRNKSICQTRKGRKAGAEMALENMSRFLVLI